MNVLLAAIAVCVSCVCFGVSAQPGDDTHGITLERIMADPEWIGQFPERSYWSDDGKSVLFFRDAPGGLGEDFVSIDLSTGEETLLGMQERAELARASWVYSADRSARVCSRGGDLFYEGLSDAKRVQLTRTVSRESSPRFLSGGKRIGYESGGDWFVFDLVSGSVSQVADVRFEDEPKDEEEEDGDDYLDRQQERLFTTITKRQERDRHRRDVSRQVTRASTLDVPGPFYIGKKYQRRRHALSDDGRFLAVVISEPWENAERDEMPAYVTEDGYVDTSSVRHKVGVRESPAEMLFLIDTHKDTSVRIDLSGLPGITDDPLAFLRVDETIDADEADEATEPEPRPVSIGNLSFRPGSGSLVFRVSSHDHKDRWIVSVDLGEDEPVAQSLFRESTEGWINWRTNRMGWTPNGERFWFLSEYSGFSHIHAYEGGSVRQVTSGSFEFWDVVQTPEPSLLLALTNMTDPAVYEVAQIDLTSKAAELVTEFGERVERFELSPAGDRLLMEVSTNDSDGELFVQEVEPGAQPTQLTHSVSKAFTQLPWIEPEYVDVPCRDGRTIRGRVYSFDGGGGATTDKPGVIFVHGAGYTQNVHRGWPYYFREMMFHSLLAYKGYVVLDIDFRASAGYGKEFREAIYRNMGGPELEDMVDTANWMVEELGVSPDRIGTYGGSYGGFLAIMASFKEPDVFTAAAALRPVTDWAHYNHGYTSNILNTPDIDPEAYERSSPIEFAEGFEGGLLICHGMLDDNVLVQDTIRLQQRLIELEKQDWEVALYPMEAHGFAEPDAWLDEYRRIYKLFETRLNTR